MDNKKSRSLRLASRLVGYLGVFACLLGALAYVILHEMGYQLVGVGPFQWRHLYVVAAFAGGIILVAVILRVISILLKTRAVEETNELEEICEEEICDEDEEICEDEACNETSDEADEICVEESSESGCAVCDLLKGKIDPETKEKIVATVKKNAPVILAVAATAIVTAAITKASADKKKAKLRRSILSLFS